MGLRAVRNTNLCTGAGERLRQRYPDSGAAGLRQCGQVQRSSAAVSAEEDLRPRLVAYRPFDLCVMGRQLRCAIQPLVDALRDAR